MTTAMTDEEFMDHPKVEETMLWAQLFGLVIVACVLHAILSPFV